MAEASCYEKAVALLARRAHFRLELERKLVKRGFEPEEIESTLARLAELGHLDERSTAEHYVTGRLRRGAFGPRRLQAELRQRGIDSDLAREVIAAQIGEQGEAGDESDLARQAAERWLRGKAGRATPAALARYLERAGFQVSLVIEQVRRFEAELEST